MRSIHRGLLLAFVLSGCDGGGSVPCTLDEDCADGMYCGAAGCAAGCAEDADCLAGEACDPASHRCMITTSPGDAGAPDGGPAPCVGDAECDDGDACTADACVSGVCANDPAGDADGDGVDSIACGGTDCDDADAEASPSHVEICDAAGHDEDCDPTTLGPDLDGDGHAPIECCNGAECGGDCDDAALTVSPDVAESCNGVDDDCDGEVDDGAGMFFYDGDRDGYGRDDDVVQTCTAPTGYVANGGDCNDTETGREINPPAIERCDDIDNNCDGTIDVLADGRACACLSGISRSCGPMDGSGALITAGECQSGTQSCFDGLWGECVGDVHPSNPPGANEVACNGLDDDCDGTVDDGLVVDCYVDNDGDRYHGATTVSRRCPDNARAAYGRCPAGYVAPASSAGLDCNDGPGGGTVWQNRNFYVDADGDGHCNGMALRCAGASPPAGHRDTCTSHSDCNDGNISVWRNLSVTTDADGDSYCTGSQFVVCAGSGAPSGTTQSCAGVDCNDGNAGQFIRVTSRNDRDGDRFCAAGTRSDCTNGSLPTYTLTPSLCRTEGDDCNDLNNQVPIGSMGENWDCSRRETGCGYGAHACPGERIDWYRCTCGAGYILEENLCRRRIHAGGGNCGVTTGSTYDSVAIDCHLNQTCNFFEATACEAYVGCVPWFSF